MNAELPRHRAASELHVFSCLNTLLHEHLVAPGVLEPLRILDIGCGDGHLMVYFTLAFRALYPGRIVEVYGFDVREHGWANKEEYLGAARHLKTDGSNVPLQERLKLISAQEPWPYPDGYFDAAVSYMVLEHVADADHFLASLRRVLKNDGVSVHQFPLAHYCQEPHLKVPFTHWIRDAELQRTWIMLSNRLGVGRWRTDKELFGEPDLAHYAESQVAYLHSYTFYRSFAEFHRLCSRQGLVLSHRFTRNFFFCKLREVLHVRPRHSYGKRSLPFIDTVAFLAIRYIASITMIVRPANYDIAFRKRAEKNAGL